MVVGVGAVGGCSAEVVLRRRRRFRKLAMVGARFRGGETERGLGGAILGVITWKAGITYVIPWVILRDCFFFSPSSFSPRLTRCLHVGKTLFFETHPHTWTITLKHGCV